MRIFVTGASGFIGSHFIQKIHQKGHSQFCLKREHSNVKIKLGFNPEWVISDLDGNFIKELSQCDVLVHLAAHSTIPPYDSIENCIYWNVQATLRLFELALSVGIKKFLVAGSCFEYGKTAEFYDYIPTSAPLEPASSYAVSKAMASIALKQWAVQNNLKLIYARIFQVFGRGEDDRRLWPSLKKAAYRGENISLTFGEQIRDFINVIDVANQLYYYLIGLDRASSGNPSVVHIGTGRPQSIRDFAEFWWKKWDAKGNLEFGKVPYRENEIMRFVPEIKNTIN